MRNRQPLFIAGFPLAPVLGAGALRRAVQSLTETFAAMKLPAMRNLPSAGWRQRIAIALLVSAALCLCALARGQEQDSDAMLSWGNATLDKLANFLPDAKPWGFIPEAPQPGPDFKAFANETTVNGVGYKYHALLVHKTWFFGDAELSNQLEEVRKEKEALKQQETDSAKEFWKAHGAEMQALEKAHNAETDAISKQATELAMQGKYQEAEALRQKITAFHYAPFDAMTASFDKKQQEVTDRERGLLARRRSVSFRIQTNRTPLTTAIARLSNAPQYQLYPKGTLAGHPFYRQAETTGLHPQDHPEVKLAVYLGPANFQNSQVKLSQAVPQVKCIVVWAWIYPRLDTVEADEALVKKILASIDYDGLAKLIAQ